MFRFQFELSYLAEPMLTMPMSTPWDSDTSQMEIQKSLDKTICVDDPHLPATSHVSTEDSEMDTSIMNRLEQTFEVTPSSLILETPEQAPEMKSPSGKQKSLRETLMMFRKNIKKQTAPSAATRAAVCIEEEHVQKIKYMQKEEE
ncbi:unnamed protein product, partial [Larinioides sclopetarius]